MNEPISVQDALKLISMALADCDKADRGPWKQALEPDAVDGPSGEPVACTFRPSDERGIAVANAVFFVISRATMRPMLESLKGNVKYFWQDEIELIEPGYRSYPPLAALRDHYDAVRPGWRER